MNFVEFVARICLSIGVSSIFGLLTSALTLGLCWIIVYCFKLNYGSDAYWAVNVSLIALFISWIISFAFCIRVFK